MERLSNDALSVAQRLAVIREEIERACAQAGRRPQEVSLLAVTKTVEPARINEAIAAGASMIGENRAQELLSKLPDLQIAGQPPVGVHFIGHLQTNKVKSIIDQVDLIQSLDSIGLAKEIDRQAAMHGKVMPVLVEVNIGKQESKSGVYREDLLNFLEQIAAFSHIRVDGLMCIPPICDTEAQRRKYFSSMYDLFIDIRAQNMDNGSMNILSMGMSGDFREAILEGSTMVRIGSALFGQREYK